MGREPTGTVGWWFSRMCIWYLNYNNKSSCTSNFLQYAVCAIGREGAWKVSQNQFLLEPACHRNPKQVTFPPKVRSAFLLLPDPRGTIGSRAKHDPGGSDDRRCRGRASRQEHCAGSCNSLSRLYPHALPALTPHSGVSAGGVLSRFWSDSSSYHPLCLPRFLAQNSCSMSIC